MPPHEENLHSYCDEQIGWKNKTTFEAHIPGSLTAYQPVSPHDHGPIYVMICKEKKYNVRL